MNRLLAEIALSLLLALTAAADTTLQVSLQLSPEFNATPGEEIEVMPAIRNVGNETALEVFVSFTLPPGSVFTTQTVNTGWSCTADRNTMNCHIPSFAPGPEHAAAGWFKAIVGGEASGEIGIPYSVSAANAPRVQDTLQFAVWRLLTITNTNDSGPGSFRDILERANQLCTAPPEECQIAFDVPTPATFEPLTPLPALTACGLVWIDAVTPLSPGGDNLYELSGAKVSSGSGLEVRANCNDGSRMLWIYGLTINRFPEDGLRIQPSGSNYEVRLGSVHIGTDSTGTIPRPNAWRGITVAAPNAILSLGGSHVSANGRSGVFIWDALAVDISSTTIAGNGASGIFLNRGILRGFSNTIVHNAQWGISVVPGAHMGMVQNNSIHSNGAPAIDWGLDGRTGTESAGGAAAPVVQSATFNAADGTTTVRGTIEVKTVQGAGYGVNIYSNASGHAEAEQWEGRSAPFSIYVPSPGIYPWEVVIRKDLRGRTLTALTGVTIADDFPTYTGSELSWPFTVQ
jgi:uncharacterized repeat protein (TIGR01451 family)